MVLQLCHFEGIGADGADIAAGMPEGASAEAISGCLFDPFEQLLGRKSFGPTQKKMCMVGHHADVHGGCVDGLRSGAKAIKNLAGFGREHAIASAGHQHHMGKKIVDALMSGFVREDLLRLLVPQLFHALAVERIDQIGVVDL